MTNIINLTDSYKFSHFLQYPKGTEIMHSYLAPRGGKYEKVVMQGLPYYLENYLKGQVITQEYIEESARYAKTHGVPFNREGWEYILKEHGGKLPIEIKALPEGSIVGNKEPLMTIENTDPNCAWVVGYLETLLLKIWYPSSVDSKSLAIKEMLMEYWKETSDNIDGVDFAFHNFGDRGSTSVESAAIGGVAHLQQFKGTDNFNSQTITSNPAFSVVASEHSTVSSWGRENEFAFYENFLETFKNENLISCVMDTYDVYKAVDFVTSGKMKEKIESDNYPVWVLRPDSGSPITVIEEMLNIMETNNIKFHKNSKGYDVFDNYRILWGDGITPDTIEEILKVAMYSWNLSAENFAFGSGGDLMQNVNRDTCKFAMKCSAIKVNGDWRDVYKDPITDPGKKSIRGRVIDDRMKTVFLNGEIIC